MRLSNNNEVLNIEFQETSVQTLPKLFLDSPRIVISDEFVKYEEVHMDSDLFGSKKFMDVNNEIDVMLFGKKDLRLKYLEIEIPLNIKFNFENEISDTSNIGILSMDKEVSFYLDKIDSASYDENEGSILLLYSSSAVLSTKTECKLVAKDFYLLHQAGIIIGWQLRNCHEYICDYFGAYQQKLPSNYYVLLSRFFSQYNESTFDKMANQDLNFRSELDSLKSDSSKSNFSVIAEVIEGWVEDYY